MKPSTKVSKQTFGFKSTFNILVIQGPRVKFDTFEKKFKKCHNSFKKWLIYEFKKVIILYGCVL